MVLRWLLERPEISRHLFETTYFEDTINLLPSIVSGNLPLPEKEAVLLTTLKIILYADTCFSIVTIPFEDAVFPLLLCGSTSVAVRAWWVVTGAVRREPRWIVPELLRFGVFAEFGDRIAGFGFKLKNAAVECAVWALKSASACEWAALAGDAALFGAILENIDTADPRSAASVDAVCARTVREGGWHRDGPHDAALREIDETCAGAGVECPRIRELVTAIESGEW
jgi:hypothetical protein